MNKMTTLQQAIITRLTAVDALVPAPTPVNGAVSWITEDIGDFATAIAKTVGALGIVGIVMTPGGGKLFDVGVMPISFRCAIEIQTQENVTINRGTAGTQIPSLDLVEFIMKRLHLYSPQSNRAGRIELDEVPYLLIRETPTLVYNVRFNAPLTIASHL